MSNFSKDSGASGADRAPASSADSAGRSVLRRPAQPGSSDSRPAGRDSRDNRGPRDNRDSSRDSRGSRDDRPARSGDRDSRPARPAYGRSDAPSGPRRDDRGPRPDFRDGRDSRGDSRGDSRDSRDSRDARPYRDARPAGSGFGRTDSSVGPRGDARPPRSDFRDNRDSRDNRGEGRGDSRGDFRDARPSRDERPARSSSGSGFGRADTGGQRDFRDSRDSRDSRGPGGDSRGGFGARDGERRPFRSEGGERGADRGGDRGGERRSFDRPDRPERQDRPFRSEGADRGGDRGGERRSFDRPDRPERQDRPFRSEGGDRPRFQRDDRAPSPRGPREGGRDGGRGDAPRGPRGPGGAGGSGGFGRRDDRGGDRKDFRGSRDDRGGDRGGEERHIPGSFVSESERRPTTGIRTYRPSSDGSDRAIPVKRAPEEETRQDDRPGVIRINKRIADMGMCSRREADEWVENGWVRVNGVVAVMGQNVVPADRIDVDKKAQERQDQQVTILIHKPMGYVSGQAEDGHEPAVVLVTNENRWNQDTSKTRFNFSQLKGLAPCGRLDIDSVGLLVMTQDGRVARQIIGEESVMEKEYLVRVTYGERDIDVQSAFPEDQLALLRHGLSLDDQPLQPAKVDWQNPEQLRFVLTEGKKRQIRRMCEQVGLRVVGLKRISIGRITLGNLPVGQWRYLGAHEQF